MPEIFEKVELILDQAFGDALRARIGDAIALPDVVQKALPPRF